MPADSKTSHIEHARKIKRDMKPLRHLAVVRDEMIFRSEQQYIRSGALEDTEGTRSTKLSRHLIENILFSC